MKTMKPSSMDDRVTAAYIGQEIDSGVLLYNKFATKRMWFPEISPKRQKF